MIIWINGAFGSGKTTLVTELHRLWPDALVYDPELVGFAVRQVVPVPTGDFQDLRLWRRQVASMALGLIDEYKRPLLAPMTLVNPQYLDEIFSELREAGATIHHFFLSVSVKTLASRIDAQTIVAGDPEHDERVRQWRRAQIERCVAAPMPQGTVVLDGEAPTDVLAKQALHHIGVSPVR
ncbi:AAA family ATPase [Streptomyces cyaneofuscatus]|uniref:AAA family ATPase n=1 Tax=Streptomyces cyaneofuscatus TaxID=66883 RepID=UPI0033AC0E70